MAHMVGCREHSLVFGGILLNKGSAARLGFEKCWVQPMSSFFELSSACPVDPRAMGPKRFAHVTVPSGV